MEKRTPNGVLFALGFTRVNLSLGLFALITRSLEAQTVGSGADLNAAIASKQSTITFSSNITTSASSVYYTAPFAGIISFNTTISGSGYTLNGGSTVGAGGVLTGGATPLFIASATNETATGGSNTPTAYAVSISNLTVTAGLSQGGASGRFTNSFDESGGGSGAGAGLGGGIFVGTGATVTLNSVIVTGNAASGGTLSSNYTSNQKDYGAGGIGGNGSGLGGGGLFANSSTTSNVGGGANGGTVTTKAGVGGGGNGSGGINDSGGFGGGGGVGGYLKAGVSAGTGGFGGGGSGFGPNQNSLTDSNYLPQAGGFGGGGSASTYDKGAISKGGFGAGSGTLTKSGNYLVATGGSGAGLGGGIFVQKGGTVIVTGNSTIAGNNVYAASDATAAGADLFMMTGSKVILAPGATNNVTIGALADNTSTISDIADDSLASVTHGNVSGAASGGTLTIGESTNPGGLVTIYGNNTYSGGTTISNSTTLQVYQNSSLGSTATTSIVTLETHGELLTNSSSSNPFTSARAITLVDNGTLAATTGSTASFTGTISGYKTNKGVLQVGDGTNSGLVMLSGKNTYSGGTVISNATLEVTADDNLGATGTSVTLDSNGELLTNLAGFSTTRGIVSTNTGSDYGILAATTGTGATFTGVISGENVQFGDANHSGATFLKANEIYSGTTAVVNGKVFVGDVTVKTTKLDVRGGSILFSTGTPFGTTPPPVTLAGGNLGFQTGLGKVSLAFGALTLASNTTSGLYFGTESGNKDTLKFDSLTLGTGSILKVYDYNGSATSGTLSTGSAFVLDNGSLGYISEVEFFSGTAADPGTELGFGAKEIAFGSDYELVPNPTPVPEISSLWSALGLVGLLSFLRKRAAAKGNSA